MLILCVTLQDGQRVPLCYMYTYVSASEILGPIDEMTSLSKMTSKYTSNYRVFNRNFNGQQTLYKVSKLFKKEINISYICTII